MTCFEKIFYIVANKRRQNLGFCRGLLLSLAIRISRALIFFIKTAKINGLNEKIRITKTTFIFGKCGPDVWPSTKTDPDTLLCLIHTKTTRENANFYLVMQKHTSDVIRISRALIFFIKTAKINGLNEKIRITKTTFIFGKCGPDVWPSTKTDPDTLLCLIHTKTTRENATFYLIM